MKKWIVLLILPLLVSLFFPYGTQAALASLAGRILLQVEENGEAWYVEPGSLKRFYLGRPADAFSLMREKGLGVKEADLRRIPVGLSTVSGLDSDQDALPDELEKALNLSPIGADTDKDGFDDRAEISSGNDPLGPGPWPIDKTFARKQAGRILLQVESRGEAWYVYPVDNKRYFLGRPADAFRIMRALGLGISNADISQIVAYTPSFTFSEFEKLVFDLVNAERQKAGLSALRANGELSGVARRHSDDLARENEAFTALDSFCSFPLIHHEGLNFGIYHGDRLETSAIRYYNMSGENIALLSGADITLSFRSDEANDADFDRCESLQAQWDKALKAALDNESIEASRKVELIRSDISKRKTTFESYPRLRISRSEWTGMADLAKATVKGWMESPGHRANILKPEYDEAGLGAAYVNAYVITTQVFIRRTDCGYLGAPCCDRGQYQACYEPNTCSLGKCVNNF